MVRNDGDRVWRRDEPGTHGMKRINDREKFFVVNFIVDFGRGKFAGMKGDRVEKIISVWLEENRGKGEVGSIGYKCRRKQRVEVVKKGRVVKENLSTSKACLAGLSRPLKDIWEVFVVNRWRGEATSGKSLCALEYPGVLWATLGYHRAHRA